MRGQEVAALGCARVGSGWILGKSSSQCGQALAQLPREMVGSLSLEVLKNHGDVVQKGVISGYGGVGWGWALGSERSLPTIMIT